MDTAKKISSVVCYLSGTIGLTITQDVSDILGIILTAVSIVSMLICLIVNLISRIKKATEDGKVTDKELKQILGEIEKTKKEINNELKRNDQDKNGSK